MRLTLLFALIVASASSGIMAAAKPFGIDNETAWFTDDRGNTLSVYRKLIEDTGNGRVEAWVETKLPKAAKTTSGMLKSMKSLYEFDCNGRSKRTLFIAAYGPDGATLRSSDVNQSSRPIVPGTVGELEFAAVCKLAGYDTKNSFSSE